MLLPVILGTIYMLSTEARIPLAAGDEGLPTANVRQWSLWSGALVPSSGS